MKRVLNRKGRPVGASATGGGRSHGRIIVKIIALLFSKGLLPYSLYVFFMNMWWRRSR